MTASVSFWSGLIQSVILLPSCTILPSHFALPHLHFTSAMLQSSHRKLGWLRGCQLIGEHVSGQLHWTMPHRHLHAGKTPLQLVWVMGTSLSLMESQVASQQFFLDTLVMWDLLPSHQMGYHLHLEVGTRPSGSGICRLVGLPSLSMATPNGFLLFLSHQIVQLLFQGLQTRPSACGTFKQRSVTMSYSKRNKWDMFTSLLLTLSISYLCLVIMFSSGTSMVCKSNPHPMIYKPNLHPRLPTLLSPPMPLSLLYVGGEIL